MKDLFCYNLENVPRDWRVAYIPKKSGGKRKLHIPNDDLKEVQKAILQYFYQQRREGILKVSAMAHGFVPHRSCMTSILKHAKNSAIFVATDIEGFFDHVTAEQAEMVFLDAGWNERWAKTITDLCQCEGVMPQGGPTSPFITNLVMLNADCQIASYAHKHGFKYTRYADDMLFSLLESPPEILSQLRKSKGKSKNPYLWFLFGVEKILQETLGLNLNHKKDHIIFRGAKVKPHMLGICVRQDEHGYNAVPRKRRTARARVCNLYHKVFDNQGGKAEYDDKKEWQSVKGVVRYMDKTRSFSDPGYDGVDPKIQEHFFCRLEALLDGAAV